MAIGHAAVHRHEEIARLDGAAVQGDARDCQVENCGGLTGKGEIREYFLKGNHASPMSLLLVGFEIKKGFSDFIAKSLGRVKVRFFVSSLLRMTRFIRPQLLY
jgi:hypothetical protein